MQHDHRQNEPAKNDRIRFPANATAFPERACELPTIGAAMKERGRMSIGGCLPPVCAVPHTTLANRGLRASKELAAQTPHLPAIERLLGDAHWADDVRHCHPQFCLLQHRHDLFH